MQSQRLVIRIKLPAQGEPPAPAPSRLNKGVLLLIAVVVAVLLTWAGMSMFRSEPIPAPAAVEAPVPVPAKPVEPEVLEQPEAPPSPINEVIPTVSRSALNTISGTIRVTVRVSIDKQGAVVDATAIERGPSRYFERVSLEAARKWTFTPANSQAQRTMLVRFYFRRSRASAEAEVP